MRQSMLRLANVAKPRIHWDLQLFGISIPQLCVCASVPSLTQRHREFNGLLLLFLQLSLGVSDRQCKTIKTGLEEHKSRSQEFGMAVYVRQKNCLHKMLPLSAVLVSVLLAGLSFLGQLALCPWVACSYSARNSWTKHTKKGTNAAGCQPLGLMNHGEKNI